MAEPATHGAVANAEAQTWRLSQHWPKTPSQDADSHIPASRLQGEHTALELFEICCACGVLPLVLMAVSILAASLSGSKSRAGTTVGNLGSSD